MVSFSKVLKARGKRSRKEIADASNGKITPQDLRNWETGQNRPSPKRLPYLLEALGVTFDEIAVDARRAAPNQKRSLSR